MVPTDMPIGIPSNQTDPNHNPDAFGTMMSEMSKRGIEMDLRKRNRKGDYESADANDMNMIKTQSKLANTGDVLSLICVLTLL